MLSQNDLNTGDTIKRPHKTFIIITSVAHLIGFAFDGERGALCEGHVASVGGPMDIGDRPNFHVEHLRLGSHDCEADDYE